MVHRLMVFRGLSEYPANSRVMEALLRESCEMLLVYDALRHLFPEHRTQRPVSNIIAAIINGTEAKFGHKLNRTSFGCNPGFQVAAICWASEKHGLDNYRYKTVKNYHLQPTLLLEYLLGAMEFPICQTREEDSINERVQTIQTPEFAERIANRFERMCVGSDNNNFPFCKLMCYFECCVFFNDSLLLSFAEMGFLTTVFIVIPNTKYGLEVKRTSSLFVN